MPYQAGVGVRDITPADDLIAAGKIWLWGYGNRSAPCAGVRSPLSARALAIRADDGKSIVLVTLDLGALDPETTARLRTHISARFGIGPECVCVNVSHTHGAPVPVSIPTWQMGVAIAQPEYMVFLEDQAFAAVAAALERLEPAQLSWARGETRIGHDRHFYPSTEFYDPTLDVLLVRRIAVTSDLPSSVIATAFFAACHPMCNGDLNLVYADFPGVAREAVEGELGGTAFFFQGYGGTCRPGPDPATKLSDSEIGWQLAADVIAVADDLLHQLEGPIDARLHTIELPLRTLDPATLPAHQDWAGSQRAERPDAADLIDRWVRHMRSMAPSFPSSLPTQQQAIRIGAKPDQWSLIASSHEVAMDFGPRLRAIWPDSRITVIGYSNSQLSYLPSANVILNPDVAINFPRDASNYEGAYSFVWYGHPGPLTVDADHIFIEGFVRLLETTNPG
jgi:hypothetical protein